MDINKIKFDLDDLEEFRRKGDLEKAYEHALCIESNLKSLGEDQNHLLWATLLYEKAFILCLKGENNGGGACFARSRDHALKSGFKLRALKSEYARLTYLNLADLMSDSNAYDDCINIYKNFDDLEIKEEEQGFYSSFLLDTYWRLIHLSCALEITEYRRWSQAFKGHNLLSENLPEEYSIARLIQYLQVCARDKFIDQDYSATASILRHLTCNDVSSVVK